jgi:hypothetical protein
MPEGFYPQRSLDRENAERERREAEEQAAQAAREEQDENYERGIRNGTVADKAIPAWIPRFNKTFIQGVKQEELRKSILTTFDLFLCRYPEASKFDLAGLQKYMATNLLNGCVLQTWEYAFARCIELGILVPK